MSERKAVLIVFTASTPSRLSIGKMTEIYFGRLPIHGFSSSNLLTISNNLFTLTKIG